MRTLFLAVALLTCTSVVVACDICGCSIGGNYFGILPQFNRNFVGLRWSSRSFRSLPEYNLAGQLTGASRLDGQTLDLMVRFYPLHRVQVLALMPYHFFEHTDEIATSHVSGLGDATLLLNYILLNNSEGTWRHTVLVGGGIKLPTGANNLALQSSGAIINSVQPGTGSTDFIASAAWTARHGAWGVATDAFYRWNTTNANGLRFGNRLNGSAKFFYWKNVFQHLQILPNAGLFAETASYDVQNNYRQNNTGGSMVLGLLGLDVHLQHFSAGITSQTPLTQSLNGGLARAGQRWLFTLNYIF